MRASFSGELATCQPLMEKGKAKEDPEGDQETQWIEAGEGAGMVEGG